MFSASACDTAAAMLTRDDFYSPINGMLYHVMQDMASGGVAIDAMTLAEHLASRGLLGEIGGVEYVVQILETVPHAEHVAHYCKTVKRKSQRRQLIVAAADIERVARDETSNVKEAAASITDRVDQIFYGTNQALKPASIVVENYIASKQVKVDRIKTGLTDLDNALMGGFAPGLALIAARPSMGKTGMMMNIAYSAAKASIPVSIFSMEMTSVELMDRVAARGKDALEEFSSLPIYIDDDTTDFDQLKMQIRQSVRKNRSRIVIIDYLDEIELTTHKRSDDNQVITHIMKGLRRLRKSLGITIVLLCQLNRKLEERDDKRPRLSDLRGSGRLEHSADVILGLHRPSYFDPEDRPGEAEVLVMKQRGGPRNVIVRCGFNDARTEFVPLQQILQEKEYEFSEGF